MRTDQAQRLKELEREPARLKKKVLFLMRQLLEADMSLTGSARIAVSGKSVFACATVPLVELIPGDVPVHIDSVMGIAKQAAGSLGPFDFAEIVPTASEGVKPEGPDQGQTPFEPPAGKQG